MVFSEYLAAHSLPSSLSLLHLNSFIWCSRKYYLLSFNEGTQANLHFPSCALPRIGYGNHDRLHTYTVKSFPELHNRHGCNRERLWNAWAVFMQKTFSEQYVPTLCQYKHMCISHVLRQLGFNKEVTVNLILRYIIYSHLIRSYSMLMHVKLRDCETRCFISQKIICMKTYWLNIVRMQTNVHFPCFASTRIQ